MLHVVDQIAAFKPPKPAGMKFHVSSTTAKLLLLNGVVHWRENADSLKTFRACDLDKVKGTSEFHRSEYTSSLLRSHRQDLVIQISIDWQALGRISYHFEECVQRVGWGQTSGHNDKLGSHPDVSKMSAWTFRR